MLRPVRPDPVPAPPVGILQRAKNILRTAKARAQRSVNAATRRLQQSVNPPHGELAQAQSVSLGSNPESRNTLQAHLQHWFFTGSLLRVQYQEDYSNSESTGHAIARDRARSVMSLVKAFANIVTQLFRREGRPARISHVLNTHIVDDTSTRLRGPSKNDPVAMYTIMNTVQDLHVRYESERHGSGSDTEDRIQCSMRVPTPMAIMETADKQAIHKAFISSSLVTSDGVGQTL